MRWPAASTRRPGWLRSADGTLAEVPRKVKSNMVGAMLSSVGVPGCHGASVQANYILNEQLQVIPPLKKPLTVFLLLVFVPVAASAARYLWLGDGRGTGRPPTGRAPACCRRGFAPRRYDPGSSPPAPCRGCVSSSTARHRCERNSARTKISLAVLSAYLLCLRRIRFAMPSGIKMPHACAFWGDDRRHVPASFIFPCQAVAKGPGKKGFAAVWACTAIAFVFRKACSRGYRSSFALACRPLSRYFCKKNAQQSDHRAKIRRCLS
jgi:hypothetical protein